MDVNKPTNGEPDVITTTSHVSIKIPMFLEGDAPSWFIILEAQFALATIKSEQTKFLHVLSNLPAQIIKRLPRAIVIGHRYEELKREIIALLEQSKPEVFNQLLAAKKGTGKPSAFLSEILEMASQVGVGDELIRHKFIQSLPSAIAPILATMKETKLEDLGKL